MTCGILAAGWIDRLRRRPVLITANLTRALVLATVAVGAAAGLLTAELLYPAGLILSGLDVVFMTTFAAYVPALASPASLASTNAARATSSAAPDVAGPAVAGVLITTLGAPVAVVVDAVSFHASVSGLVLVRNPELAPIPAVHRRDVLAEIIEGWRV